jgi:hypothetical protein
MKSIVPVAAVLAACLLASGSASAAKKCNIVGTWTDQLVGASASFTTEKRGSATIGAICPSAAYVLTVTTLTNSTWDITGKAKASAKCPTIAAALTFTAGGCTQASGTITVEGQQPIPDTFNKTASIKVNPATRSNALSAGIK